MAVEIASRIHQPEVKNNPIDGLPREPDVPIWQGWFCYEPCVYDSPCMVIRLS